MGNFFSRVINYFNSDDEIVYSRELCISLPVTQNDIYKENNKDIKDIKHIKEDVIYDINKKKSKVIII